MVIFVTGCARSGTSLTTKIIEALGANLGRGHARINSLYENVDVRENVLKPYLRYIGVDPVGQYPLPSADRALPRIENTSAVLRYIPEPEPRAYKDAKLSLVWRAWDYAWPDAKWVLVRRDRAKIVDSCLRTSFMRAFDDRAGWNHWVDEHEQRFEAMRASLDLIEIWPADYIDDAEAFRPVATFCGLPFDDNKVRASVDRSVWH